MASGTPHGIAVHSSDASFGKLGFDFCFESLCSQSAISDSIESTGRACGRCGDGEVAVVADCLASIPVVRERHVAVGAGNNVSTRGALDCGRETTPIKQQDGLSMVLECFLQGRVKRAADCSRGPIIFHPQVDQLYVWHGQVIHPGRQRDHFCMARLRRLP